MAKYVMALDAGTTSNRCILFNEKERSVRWHRKSSGSFFPNPGWVEHDANEIWSTMLGVAVEAMNMIGAAAADIAAIGITNQRETAIVWNKETGEPVYNAIVWQCRRTSDIADGLKKKKDWKKFTGKKTGLIIDAYFSATKIKWILDNVKRCKRAGERGQIIIRYRGDLADLEVHQGCGACDRLFQRIPYDAVQHQRSVLGQGDFYRNWIFPESMLPTPVPSSARFTVTPIRPS